MSTAKTVQTVVHGLGPNYIAVTPNGKWMYTAGNEGYIRVFDLFQDTLDNPALIEYHDDMCTDVSCSNEYVCSSNETGNVVLHKHGKVEAIDRYITRCSFPVRSAQFDPKGKRVAVTSDEVVVKVVDVEDPTKIQLLAGHKKAVRAASWSPDGQLLATCSADGEIRIWEWTSGEVSCIQVLNDVIEETEPESECSVRVVWHPSSRWFVVPTRSKEIGAYSREGWRKIGTFSSSNGHAGRVSYMAFSPNGKYLATAGEDLNVLVWSTTPDDRHVVSRTAIKEGVVTGIVFYPSAKANIIAFIDTQGQLTRWDDVVPSNLPLPTAMPAARQREERSVSVAATDASGDVVSKRRILPKKSAAGTAAAATAATSTTEKRAGGDDDNKSEFGDMFDDDQGWLEDDDDMLGGVTGRGDDDDHAGLMARIPPRLGANGAGGATGGYTSRLDSARDYDSAALVVGNSGYSSKGQEPFQPGSTPFREGRRYLAFNMLGLITVVERDDQHLITMQFHDQSVQAGSHFTDSFQFTMGALGELGSVFACKGNGESPSLVYYRSFESWTVSSEWQYSLPHRENATVVAVGGIAPDAYNDDLSITGSGTVLVATDKGYVRFFTGSGLQKYVWNLGDEVVTMAAGREWAVVVYRGGSGAVDGRQNLEYALVDMDNFEVVQQGRVPLGRGVTLKWIGFSDEQIPAMYDSNGVLSLLDRSRRPKQARWVPVLDTTTMPGRENRQESYWPVGATQQYLHAIILKGEERHPGFPTPLFQELDLKMPLLRLDVQQGELEEKFLRESVFLTHRRDGAPPDDYVTKTEVARQELASDKNLLMLIQTACKAEKLEAALDAALLLSQPASLDAAAKIARFFNLPGLEDRMHVVEESKTGIRKHEDENKRQSKYAHLVDDRTITSGGAEYSTGGSGVRGGRGVNMFAAGAHAPASSYTPRPPMSSAAAPIGRTSTTSVSRSAGKRAAGEFDDMDEHDGVELDTAGEVGEMDVDAEYEDSGARSPKRARSDSTSDLESHEQPQSRVIEPPKKAANPFAKRAKTAAETGATQSSPANPFANKKAGKAADLKGTRSFFDRVEGKEGSVSTAKSKNAKKTNKGGDATATSNGKNSIPGTRQTTLFGLPAPSPAAVVDSAKRGRGRPKKDAAAESTSSEETGTLDGLVTVTSASSSVAKKMAATGANAGLGSTQNGRELPKEGDAFEETQADTQPETQLDFQPETQVDTQTDTQLDQPRTGISPVAERERSAQADTEKENMHASKVAPASTASKLEKFRRAEPVSVPAVTSATSEATAGPAPEPEPATPDNATEA